MTNALLLAALLASSASAQTAAPVTLAARLAAGPVTFACRQILIDAPGGSDALRFTVAPGAVAGQLELKLVQHGYFSGRPGSKPSFRYSHLCDKVSTASFYAPWNSLDATCQGAVVDGNTKKRDAVEHRVFVQSDNKSGAVFAKLEYPGRGRPDEFRSAFLCE